MKLYYAPGACSLADHIALLEAGLPFEIERVDIKLKKTASGRNFLDVNPFGYVPALQLEDGTIVTENLAILESIAARMRRLGVAGPHGHTRLLEALSFVGTELHKPLRPFFTGGSDAEKAAARSLVEARLQQLSGQVRGDYLFGHEPTVADFYLLVILLWCEKFDVMVPVALESIRRRLLDRPSVREAMAVEQWAGPASAKADSQGAHQVAS